MVVTESWLSPNPVDGEIGEEGRVSSDYPIHQHDRVTTTKEGGVFIAVRNDLKSTQCTELELEGIDMDRVKIEVSGVKSLFVGAFYRPSVRDTDDLRLMMDSMQRLSSQTVLHIWLMGDFNLPNIDWCQDVVNIKYNTKHKESHEAFLDMLDAAALTQTVREPIRDENNLDSSQPKQDPHHKMYSNSRDIRPRHCTKRQQTKTTKESSTNMTCPHMETGRLEWHKDPHRNSLVQPTRRGWGDSRALWDWFTSTLEEAIEAFIPHRHTQKSEGYPWISRPLKCLLKKEKRLNYRKWHKLTRCNISKLKRVQQQVQKCFWQEYWRYINGILFPAENQDPENGKKTLWNYIKNCKKDSIGLASLRNSKTAELLTEAKDKAKVLNDQFQSVLSCCTPLALGQLCAQTARLLPQAMTPGLKRYPAMPDFTITTNDIKKMLATLKPQKVAGPDCIRALIPKELRDTIAPILQVIFTRSFKTGKLHQTGKKPASYLSSRKDPSCQSTIDLSHWLASAASWWNIS